MRMKDFNYSAPCFKRPYTGDDEQLVKKAKKKVAKKAAKKKAKKKVSKKK